MHDHDDEGSGGRPAPEPWLGVVATAVRLLTFRLTREESLRLGSRHLAFGLVATWIAGMGRYWDHPDAARLQYAGLGSVIYVFALSLLLFLIIWPLRPKDWTYLRVLTFVTLTSPPAILYALPVERFFSLDAAQQTNMWFLAVVAIWRVALLLFFLRRGAQMSWPALIIAALLPLALIVVALSLLNLEHVVFDLMSGIDPAQRSPNDAAFTFVVGLAVLSFQAAPVLVIAYLIAVWRAARRR